MPCLPLSALYWRQGVRGRSLQNVVLSKEWNEFRRGAHRRSGGQGKGIDSSKWRSRLYPNRLMRLIRMIVQTLYSRFGSSDHSRSSIVFWSTPSFRGIRSNKHLRYYPCSTVLVHPYACPQVTSSPFPLLISVPRCLSHHDRPSPSHSLSPDVPRANLSNGHRTSESRSSNR